MRRLNGVGGSLARSVRFQLIRLLDSAQIAALFSLIIDLKLAADRHRVPELTENEDRYRTVHYLQLRRRLALPRLYKPVTFSDLIARELLFPDNPHWPDYVDKVEVKEKLLQLCGRDVSPRTLLVVDTLKPGDFGEVTYPCVLKCNHDSGSVKVLHSQPPEKEADALCAIFNQRKRLTYGVETGEWFYSKIKPRIFFEEIVLDARFRALADWKFHCLNGKVKFVQVVYGRQAGSPREFILDTHGNLIDVQFTQNRGKGDPFPVRDESWTEMLRIAALIAQEFNYVRVDMYDSQKGPLVGELTFTPRAGNYRSRGNRVLGKILLES